MRAAGDATRTRILKMLQNRELCVCQIMAVLNMSSSTVSRHLSILRMAGLVRDRKEGRWVYYSWEDAERNIYASAILAGLSEWLEEDPQMTADRVQLMRVLETPLEELCIEAGRVRLLQD